MILFHWTRLVSTEFFAGSGKGIFADLLGCQTVSHFPTTAVLPYDCVMNRQSRVFIPQNKSIALIGDTDAGNIVT